MGQKVNPVGFRLLNNKNWDSVWYDNKGYAQKIINDIKIRQFIQKKYSHCGIGKIVVERPSDKIILIIKTSKPGVLIGKKGNDKPRHYNYQRIQFGEKWYVSQTRG